MKPTTTGSNSSAKAKVSPKKKIPQEVEPKVSRTSKPDDMELEEWQTRLRRQFAEGQPFQLKNVGAHPIFSEFTLTNPATDHTYRRELRRGNCVEDVVYLFSNSDNIAS